MNEFIMNALFSPFASPSKSVSRVPWTCPRPALGVEAKEAEPLSLPAVHTVPEAQRKVRHDSKTGQQKEKERERKVAAAFIPTFSNSS